MSTGEKIYLSIFGNPVRSAGSKVLLSGACPFPMEYEGYYGTNNVPYAFVVKVCEKFTLFKLFCNHVTTSDGHPGTLVFAASIPAMHTIEGDKSSYDLLMDVRREFIDKYMNATPGAVIAESYIFKPINSLIDEWEFASILNKYPLVQKNMPHYPMSGTEPAALQLEEEKIKRLFNDVNYYGEQLAIYKEIVIAQNVDTNYYPNRDLTGKIEVPRKRMFTILSDNPINIFVNNSQIASRINKYIINENDFSKTITITSTEDPQYYNQGSISFIVDDLLEGIRPPGVMIDYKTIRCSVKGKEKEEFINIKPTLPFGDNTSKVNLMKYIIVSLNKEPLTITNGYFTLRGTQLMYKSALRISIDKKSGYEITKVPWKDPVTQNTIIIELKPIIITTTTETTRENKISTGNRLPNSGMENQQGEIKLKVKIQNADDFIENNTVRVRVISITSGKGSPDLIFEKRTKLQSATDKISSKRFPKNPIAELTLTRDWKGREVRISLIGFNETTCGSDIFLNHDNTEVNIDAWETIPIKRTSQKIRNIYLLITLLLFIGCITFGYLYFNTKSSSDSKEVKQKNEQLEKDVKNLKTENNKLKTQLKKFGNADQASSSQNVNNGNKDKVAEEINIFFKSVDQMLKKQDLTFKNVIRKYEEFENKRWSENDLTNREELVEKLKAYYEVVNILKSGDKENIKQLDENSNWIKKLSKEHQINVLAIYRGDFRKEPPVLWREEDIDGKQGAKEGLNYYITNRTSRFNSFNRLNDFLNSRPEKQGVR